MIRRFEHIPRETQSLAVAKLLLEQGSIVQLAIIVCAAVYSHFIAPFVPSFWLSLWLASTAVLVIIRWSMQFFLSRQGPAYLGQNLTWVLPALYVGVLSSALLWGATGWFLLHTHDSRAIMVTTIILAGLSSGGVAAYSVSSRLLSAFLVLIVGPLAVSFAFSENHEFRYLGGLTVFYLILVLVGARNIRRYNLESIILNLENKNLIRRLNDASHEIRTPVSAIVGFAEVILSSKNLPRDLIHHAQVLHRNSVYLSRLIDNLFLMSQVDANSCSDKLERVEIRSFIELAVSLVANAANKKKLELAVEVADEVSRFAVVYSVNLQQILVNLLNNAVKFTEKGLIRLQVLPYSRNQILIRVTDTGIGISPEARSLIFEPFWREGRLEVRDKEGAGLGLALSRQLAQKMGGSLELVETDVTHGSVFELIFPVRWEAGAEPVRVSARTQPNETNLSELLRGKRIVFVDDSEDLRSLYSYRLREVGAIVETCNDGRAAVETVHGRTDIDVVIMDLSMPHMGGLEAARTLRENGFTKLILALTAFATGTEEAQCLAAGYTAQINKSAPFHEVVATIRRHLSS